ncbi:MAG: glucose 1-dehydrogenase [Polaromonas sp.]|uniref:SDR family NAD(P)-dependent oxidoreductase n=1 Tax=Polaromonas sp. TaxID=1869339 RepID=UPI002489A5DF|nr:glucose 1-dehydrogenase [Polaromonas sp.]MDI1239995.1 glucose 1-dehydrogenase [Polaromonas sp.]
MADLRDWLDLSDRVCVVTGAASGIGAAVARALAQAGARLALLDRDEGNCQRVGEELSLTGSEVIAIGCDTSREDEVAAAADEVRARLGPCTGLVNNAGMLRSNSLDDISLEEWNAVMAVNLTGYLLCARAFSRDMREQGGGAMVHVASIAGHFPQTNSGAYSASKAGVRLLSRQMSVEWGPLGIRSNTICPGMIRTALSAAFYAQPGIEQRRSAITASKRIGEPCDIADVALFLISKRSAYVNGTDILVDGGMSSMLMDLVPRPGFNDGGPL